MRYLFISLFTLMTGQIVLADKLVLLDSENESLQARLDYTTNAKTIKAQYFTIEDDFVSTASLAYLLDAASKGAKVQILVDSMHNLMKRETMAALMMQHKDKSHENIEIREYNQFNLLRPFRYTKRMHDKGMIIEDQSGRKVMISGGRNIGGGYFGDAKKDSLGNILPIYEDSDALVMESDSINVANEYFDNLWSSEFVNSVRLFDYSRDALDPAYCNYSADSYICESKISYDKKIISKKEKELLDLAKDIYNGKHNIKFKENAQQVWESRAIEVERIDFLFDNPVGQNSDLSKPTQNIASSLYNRISQAQKSVTIISPYFIMTPEQENLFKTLREKNVTVRVITNGKRSNDVTPAHVGYIMERKNALNLGVDIFEYNGPDTLHAKMVLIDRTEIFIGSFNWDFRSQNLNREVGIIASISKRKDNNLTRDIMSKFSRIISRSTELGKTKKHNKDAGEITDSKSLNKLAQKIQDDNNNTWLWKLIYPLIKEQL